MDRQPFAWSEALALANFYAGATGIRRRVYKTSRDGWILCYAEDWPDVEEGLPLHRTEAGWPNCATCDGGGCPDCTDPA